MFEALIQFIREQFPKQQTISLHEPRFDGNEKAYVCDAIDSTFVSTVGNYVPRFEASIAKVLEVDPQQVMAVVNGTNALHLGLMAAGVNKGDLVITQALTFVATCNAIRYLDADPVFVDVDEQTLGMSPDSLRSFLKEETKFENDRCVHKGSGRTVKACVPMYTFGHGGRIEEIQSLCQEFGLAFLEDTAEALGSRYDKRPLGSFGDVSVLSFNGNKIVTTGGGGALFVRDLERARYIRHIGTTAKRPHRWAFYHDEVGYNYRMPNLNAALGVAQMEQLPEFLQQKRALAQRYYSFFESQGMGLQFIREPDRAESNYWLNAIKLKSKTERDEFLQFSHDHGVLCRPAWDLMTTLPMYKDSPRESLTVSEELADRLVNLPSSAKDFK